MKSQLVTGLVLLSLAALPASANTAKIKLTGNPKAPQGGNFAMNMPSEPTTLHPLNASDGYSRDVQGYILESLLTRNEDSYDWEPMLAESWKVSDDQMIFTFKIRSGVKWHDGKDVTVEDVKFSFDALFDDRFQTAPLRGFYEGIAKVEIIDAQTLKFTAKDKYYKNFDLAAGLTVIPKHIYDVPKGKGENLNRTLVGTGPYILDKYDRGQRIVLKRNTNWWGNSIPELKGTNNFATISYRFVKEENVEFEMFKKGDLDFMGMTGEMYVKKAVGPEWGKTVEKIKTVNKAPKSFGFIGWNFKNKLFQDVDTRVALTHLMNRRLMIQKFLYDMSIPATGPNHQLSEYASQKVKPIEFDPKAAAALLKKAGWSDTDKNGILDRVIDGQKREFRFQLLTANPDSLKYFTIYKEDLRKAGVDMDVKQVEWNAFVKLLDERKFDALALAWGGGSVDWEPKQIWHSSSMSGNGSNFISYKNEKVDKLIDEARLIMDKNKRIAKIKQIYELIAADAPYTFMFNTKYTLYGVSKKVGRPKDTYNFGIASGYWWKVQ